MIRSDPWIPLLISTVLVAIGIVANRYLLRAPLNVYDEGIILVGAQRVLDGDVPYADFWSMYPPGPFYLLAGLFAIFGESVTVERWADLVVRSLLPVALFWAVRGIGSSSLAGVCAWVLGLAWLGAFTFPSYPIYAAILLIVASITAFHRFAKSGTEGSPPAHGTLVVAGVLGVAGACFRHDFGIPYLGALVIAVALVHGRERPWTRRTVLSLAGGILTPGLVVALPFCISAGPATVFADLITTPARIMPAYRWLPYPPLLPLDGARIGFYLQPAVVILGLVAAIAFRIWPRTRTPAHATLLLAAVFGCCLLNQARVRSDSVHLLPCILAACLVGPGLAGCCWRLGRRWWSRLLLRSAGGGLIAMLAALAWNPLGQGWEHLSTGWTDLPEAGGRAGRAAISGSLRQTVAAIQAQTAAGEAIHVGVSNHDHLVINHVALYFLADRPSASPWHELHPGITTEAPTQEAIIAALDTKAVRLLVLTPSGSSEPNQSSVDSKVDLLDAYRARHYHRTQRFGPYEIWLRQDDAVRGTESP